MCMPYLGKLFGGGQRRRNNVTQSPHHSLAPTPQQSNATIQTTKTTSLGQEKNELTASMNASFNAAMSEGSVQETGSTTGQPGPSQEPQAAAGPTKPTSWLEYFGIGKNKKASITRL